MKFAIARVPKIPTPVYFGLTLLVALYFGVVSCAYALSSDYIVQDDARQGIVWLERWFDGSLFPNDYLADYALGQTGNSPGVKWLYELGVWVHLRPMLLAKLILPLLGIITSIFYFGFSFYVFPSGFCAFLSATFLSQNIWMNDDLSSGTPRAFLYPIFAGFLYYLSRNQFKSCLAFTALQTLFYPPFVLVHLCILGIRCLDFSERPLPLSKRMAPYLWAIAGLGVVSVLLFPILNHGGDTYGALVTRQQMAAMPEFAENGRTPFFIRDPLEFWFSGTSGLNPPVYPYVTWLTYVLPLLLITQRKFWAAKRVDLDIIGQIIIAALILFFAAHLVLFRLYWPSRYPYHALPFVFSISTALVIMFAGDRLQSWLRSGQFFKFSLWRKGLTVAFTAVLTILMALPFLPSIFLGFQGWIVGHSPALYQFLARQPRNTLIAGLGGEVSNIPSFALRSVLVAQEVSVPFHLDHYAKVRDRIVNLLTAQYAADPTLLKAVIQRYGIDYWLLDRTALTPRYLSKKGNDWLLQYQPQADQARRSLEAGQTPAIVSMIEPCSVVKTEDILLLDAACMVRQSGDITQK